VDSRGKINMVVNDLLMDLKSKEINFKTTFENNSGYHTDAQFLSILEKVEFKATSEQLDLLRAGFRDKKSKDKISIAKIKQMFNTIDPTYLNPKAVKSENDAKQRLNDLPDDIRESIIKIDDYLQRKNITVKECFTEMDKNGDGTISKEEFLRVLMRVYKISNFSMEKLTDVYKALDQNKDNSVSIGEFMFYI